MSSHQDTTIKLSLKHCSTEWEKLPHPCLLVCYLGIPYAHQRNLPKCWLLPLPNLFMFIKNQVWSYNVTKNHNSLFTNLTVHTVVPHYSVARKVTKATSDKHCSDDYSMSLIIYFVRVQQAGSIYKQGRQPSTYNGPDELPN